jgi:hypothetical protein
VVESLTDLQALRRAGSLHSSNAVVPPVLIGYAVGAMTKDELRDCVKDLAFAVRRIGLWARKAHPAPETDEMVTAVETRLRAIAARLGSDEHRDGELRDVPRELPEGVEPCLSDHRHGGHRCRRGPAHRNEVVRPPHGVDAAPVSHHRPRRPRRSGKRASDYRGPKENVIRPEFGRTRTELPIFKAGVRSRDRP